MIRLVRAYSTKPFYVTTPIFYVNAAPHVGHLYSMVLADTLKRWNLFIGNAAYLLTGTDEHGMKVQRAADAAGKDVKQFCDDTSQLFKDFAQLANVSNDRFMRTTDADHKVAVQKLWTTLLDKGYIYKGEHHGWYCVSDEAFVPAQQVERRADPRLGYVTVAKETGKVVEWTSEENYFFALSKMEPELVALYESRSASGDSFVVPESQARYVAETVKQGLPDLSVSRPASRFSWGIPVPGDDSQTIYVWLDALANYITAAGYGRVSDAEFADSMWPADVHVVGKDIVKFHAIYWPAFLMAAGLAVPKNVVVHSHWLMNGSKISKSDGNAVDPRHIIDIAGIDSVRYYLLCHNVLAVDGNFDNAEVINRRTADLVFKYSNLVSRVTSPTFNIARAVARPTDTVPELETKEFLDMQAELQHSLSTLVDVVDRHVRQFNVTAAINHILDIIRLGNKYTDYAAPWRADRKPAFSVIYNIAEVARVTSLVLQPFLPTYSGLALDKLKVLPECRSVKYASFGADLAYGRHANKKSGHILTHLN